MRRYFTTLGGNGRRWYGKLRQVEPTPTVTNNVVLYNALFDVANPNRALMTQMTAQVFFVIAEAHDVLVGADVGRDTAASDTAGGCASARVQRRPVRRRLARRRCRGAAARHAKAGSALREGGAGQARLSRAARPAQGDCQARTARRRDRRTRGDIGVINRVHRGDRRGLGRRRAAWSPARRSTRRPRPASRGEQPAARTSAAASRVVAFPAVVGGGGPR